MEKRNHINPALNLKSFIFKIIIFVFESDNINFFTNSKDHKTS